MKKMPAWLLALSCCVLFSCGKESVKVDEENLADYLILQPGKYILYQLDSIVKVPFNDTAYTTVSYQAKDVVDTLITDNLGRKSWRIFRSLRPLNSTSENDWQPNITYTITPTRESVEVVENNLRFEKMVLPIDENKMWSGNSHINTTPGTSLDYLDAWEYSYQAINEPFTPFDVAIDSTITVLQTDMSDGALGNEDKPADIDQDAYRTYSVEVYAKNTGLIYKYLNYWKYSARTLNANGNPTAPYPYGLKEGFGIRLRMIGHN